MNNTPDTPDTPKPPQSPNSEDDRPRRRLLRSRDDRMLAGVAGGIAAHLSVDPTLVRVGFVAATLFGGLGLAAYLVLAVVTPNDDGTGSPVEGERPSAWLVAVAAIAVLAILPGPFWGPAHWGSGWFWGGSLWLLLIVGGAVWLFLTMRDRRADHGGGGGDGDGDGDEIGSATEETQAMDASGKPARRGDGWSRLLRALAIAVLVVVGLNVAAAVAGISAWATATGHGAIVAGIVIAIGAALVGTALIGDRRWRWLIVPALVLALPAGAIAAADIRFDGDVGEREYTPASAASIPAEGYSLGVGQMTVDLRQLPWRPGRSVALRTEMGLGQTVVAVPERVCVDPDATASAGEIVVRGARSSGIDAEQVDSPPEGRAPRLLLDSEIDAGQIAVTDGPPEAVTGEEHRFGPDRWHQADDPAERARAQRACER